MGHLDSEHEHTHSHEHAHTHEHTHADGTTHTHEHTHEHAHEHSHEHGTDHDHAHSCEHTHEHSHDHGTSTDKSSILLKYMIDHNAHHAEELLDLGDTLETEGRTEAAAAIREAVELFLAGNEKLSKIEL